MARGAVRGVEQGHVWSKRAFWKVQAGKEPKDSLQSCATCKLVLPLDEPQQLMWSFGLGIGLALKMAKPQFAFFWVL